MDQNKLKYSLNNIKFKLINGNQLTAELIQELNQNLIYVIKQDLIQSLNTQLTSLIIILHSYQNELPFFTILMMDLIEQLTVFNDIVQNTENNNQEKNTCKPTDIPVPTEAKFSEPGTIYNSIIKGSDGTKEVVTYKINDKREPEEIGREIVEEPDLTRFFANLLGDDIKKENLEENDL